MKPETTIERLWGGTAPSDRRFDSASVDALPAPARRYLAHAIAPRTPLASAVRLRMHGEIRLGRWLPFQAEQVIAPARGMIWAATVRKGPMTVRGFDRIVDGEGEMNWKLFGFLPVVNVVGADVTRSGAGRLAVECVWLPSFLCGEEAAWDAPRPSEARVRLRVQGTETALTLELAETGRARSVFAERWGNPDGTGFRLAAFGAIVEEERRFGGYTIPSRLRAGWHFGSERFEREGEFFRATVDDAEFR